MALFGFRDGVLACFVQRFQSRRDTPSRAFYYGGCLIAWKYLDE